MAQPDETDPQLLVKLETSGRALTNITEYSLQSSFLTSTDGFEFTTYAEDRTKLQDLELEPVELLLNGNSQVIGRIDQSEIGGNGSAVTFRGRDFVSDLVECNVDPTLKITQGMSLFEAITLAALPVGIDSIISDDDIAMREIRCGVKGKKSSGDSGIKALTVEDLKPKPGEGIYEFCNRLCARFGVTIQPGNNRTTLVLAAPSYSQTPLYELQRTDDPDKSVANNILDARVTRDYSSFPTYTLMNAKTGESGQAKKDVVKHFDMSILASAFSDEMGRILGAHSVPGRRKPEPGIGPLPPSQLYRLLYLRDEESRTQEQLERAARRAISSRLKDTLRYSATLLGHQDPHSGALWAIDTMVRVSDSILGVNEDLWIESRTFKYSAGQGATTEIECWRPNSFVI